MVIDTAANELYVADGYVNHRVIVFDADDRRLQAALGRLRQEAGRRLVHATPARSCRARSAAPCRTRTNRARYDPNGPPAPQFRIVHAVRISKDGLVYVCDRTNDRLQVFRKDGTFVQREGHREGDVRQRIGVGRRLLHRSGSRRFCIINDGTNQQIYVLDRADRWTS